MGNVLPMPYCLLSNKNFASSKEIFATLNLKINGNSNVQEFLPDFEKAPILEFVNVYPDAAIKVCFLHYAQANWRKVQQLGLSTFYLENHQMRILIKCFTALASVPPKDILASFWALRDHISCVEGLEDLIHYFEPTYIGKY